MALSIAGCSAPAAPEAAPTITVERSKTGGVSFIVIESDNLIDGGRARLTLVCADDRQATLRFDLVRAPASPPPVRGVFAQIQIKGGPEITIELSRETDAIWVPRLPHPSQAHLTADDRENRRRIAILLHAFGKERGLTLTPPAAYWPGEKLVWSPQTYAPQLAAVQDCTALDRPS